MNRSYSKIRHIQESNQRLERRLVSERVIREQAVSYEIDEDVFNADPYELESVNGAVKITNKEDNTSLIYKIEVGTFGIWKSVDVVDFPNGDSIELKTLGFSRVESLGRFPKSEISDALKMDWGKDVIEFDDLEEENGFKFKFIKVQGSEDDSDENEDN
jgi:hypothetical protein